MPLRSRISSFWRNLVHRPLAERDLDEEVRGYAEMLAEEKIRAGMDPAAARRAALLELGGVEQVKEQVREVRVGFFLDTLWQDLRYGLRMLAKNPGFTAAAVLTLALGIGANSTIFSWINSTLLNPIPGLRNTGDLVALTSGSVGDAPLLFSYPDFTDLRDRTQSLSGLLAFNLHSMNLTGTGKPEHVWGTMVSANYFDVLGVRPALGRGFLPAEEQQPGGTAVVVISHHLWQTHFGAQESAIGATLHINRHPYTIVGVTPPLFQGSETGLRSDLWIPLVMERHVISGASLLERRGSSWLMPLGRLKPGVSREQAQQEMRLLMGQIVRQYPESHQGPTEVTAYPLWRGPYGANAYLYVLLPMLMAIAGVVLLLACANVTNLFLARTLARRREMAIRFSLGAPRSRLVRQLLVESLLLSAAAGLLAMLVTLWSSSLFVQMVPATDVPISLPAGADGTVLLGTLVLAAAASVGFGILPALRSSRVLPAAVLKEHTQSAGGPRRAWLAGGLVIAQIALSMLLLICAGLFIRAFRNAQRVHPGFNAGHVLLASVDLTAAGYTEDSGVEFERRLVARLEALPGVQSASLASWAPLGFVYSLSEVKPEGYVPRPHESMLIGGAAVTPNYVRTMQIPLLAGRDFTFHDDRTAKRVAMVNQALAQRYWPGQEPLGKRIFADNQWFEVAGIAQNSKYSDLSESPQPFFYVPMLQDYSTSPMIHLRVAGDPMAAFPAVENAVHDLNADLPVFDAATMESRVQIASTGERLAASFVGDFGLLALVLAAVGIYGVIAYATRQRTHEIGIRMALGARSSSILRLVLSQGLRLTLAGLAGGLGLSLALTRLLSSMLFGVTPTDAPTFAGVALLLGLVALAACYLPARRALSVDPMMALRHE